MFSRLFKPRWQHQNPDIRLQGVSELSPLDAGQLRQLEQLARGDASAAVRAAACGRLTDLSLLDHLINNDADATVREAAAAQVMALLAGQAPGAPDAANRLRLVSLTENTAVLAHVARYAADPACQLAALERLSDDDLRLQLALEAGDRDVRKAAAGSLECMTRLRQLTRDGRDKGVTQAARERLKALQALEQQAQQTSEAIRRLDQGLQQLAAHPDDPMLAPRTEQFQRQRDALAEHMDAQILSRVDGYLGQCRETLRAAAERDAQQQAQKQALAELHAAVDTLASIAAQSDDWYGNGTLRAALSTQKLRWETAAAEVSPPSALANAFAEQVGEWQQRLDTPPEQEPTPADKPEMPRQHADTGKWLRQLDGALAGRNLKRANRLWKLLHENNPQPDKALRNRLSARQPKLDELRDWHRFAAEPKKEGLCEQMEQLAANPLPADEQAGAIAALQQQWKALMSADPEQDENLWARFSDAGDRAWAPCASHFAELQQEREYNLAERLKICDMLADYLERLDDDNADWAAVQAVRQQAPRDWHALHPAASDKGRSRKRFSSLLESLDQRLAAASERNQRQRQALLDAALAAADSDDKAAAAQTLKQLQQQWRKAPWVQPGVHRKLNKAFRQCCDAFFKQQQAERQQHQAEREQAQARQRQLIEQLDRLLAKPLAEMDNAQLDAVLAELEQEAGDADAASSARKKVSRRRRLARQWHDWQALKQQLQALADGAADDTALDLAVALEVCSQSPSPADQESRRLRWQVEKLPGAMTGGGLPDNARQLDMLSDWLQTAPSVDDTTRERLLNCLMKLEPAA